MTLVSFHPDDVDAVASFLYGNPYPDVIRVHQLLTRMRDARATELREQTLTQGSADDFYQGQQHHRRHLRAMGAIETED